MSASKSHPSEDEVVAGKSGTKRKALVILGAHRSGTSALARILNLLGSKLALNLLGSNMSNVTGHWEPAELITIHDSMLAEAGSSWHDWRPFEPSMLTKPRLADFKAAIKKKITDEYGDAALINIKEPRICRFVWLYEDVLSDLGIEPLYILPVRHPLSVAQSLSARDKISLDYAKIIWLGYVQQAEKATRGKKRVFMSYEDLLGDWRVEISRLTAQLGLEWSNDIEAAAPQIEEFLSPTLEHYSHELADLPNDTELDSAVAATYKACLKLAAGKETAAIRGSIDKARSLLNSDLIQVAPAIAGEIAALNRRIYDNTRALQAERDALAEKHHAAEMENNRLLSRNTKIQAENEQNKKSILSLEQKHKKQGKKLRSLSAEKLALERKEKKHLEDMVRQTRELEDIKERLANAELRVSDVQTALEASESAMGQLLSSNQGLQEQHSSTARSLTNIRSLLGPKGRILPWAKSHIYSKARRLPGLKQLSDEQIDSVLAEFDQDFYLRRNPDVAEAGAVALSHYMLHGWREGRDPSLAFSTSRYLANVPDAAAKRINPLIHWVANGCKDEHRFAPIGGKATLEEPVLPGLAGLSPEQIRDVRDAFDSEYYLDRYRDISAAKIDPLEHFLLHGWREKRDPCAQFSTGFYASLVPEIAGSESNPFLHWIFYGRQAGIPALPEETGNTVDASKIYGIRAMPGMRLLPVEIVGEVRAIVDDDFYYRNHPDVKMAQKDPLEHFLTMGWREQRDPGPRFSTKLHVARHPHLPVCGINPLLHWLVVDRKQRNVAITSKPPLAKKPARVISFYLPQFHAIPENDEWWGKGFSEWTNVRPAKPQFAGHQQPRIPGELGYYDLTDTNVQRRQIELAKLYGIEGFCFYFYWFAGRRLLEKPLENWLADKTLDLPFCVCWANENWSRRWDGRDADLLISQNHSPEDDLAFIAEVAPYLRDERYIRVDGKPMLLVYRPSLFPSSKATADRWRKWCRENGIGEIYLAYTQSFDAKDPEKFGFDAAIEFAPNNIEPRNAENSVIPITEDFSCKVFDWKALVERSENFTSRDYKFYRSVNPGWDNTARRKNNATVFINSNPDDYRRWLVNAVEYAIDNADSPDERMVFVNAWNEWAEGAYLEPDATDGYAYLQATREALEHVQQQHSCPPTTEQTTPSRRIVVVSHDAHPHGAQLLAMNMSRTLGSLGFEVDLIVLGEGPLLPKFEQVANVHRIDLNSANKEHLAKKLAAFRAAGAEVAIANTTVSGLLVPYLKDAGFKVISLIHELPGILNSYKLQPHAKAIAGNADSVVFPAAVVQKGFEAFIGGPLDQAVIRPQGSYLKCPFVEAEREAVRRRVRDKHGLDAGSKIILCAGYADHRKGLDLFVDTCMEVMRDDPHAIGMWVGHQEKGLFKAQEKRIKEAGLTDRFVFTGLVDEPQQYYFAADVYALTSREDPFPSVVFESLDAKVPVVGFKGAGGFEELLARDCGILVPSLDAKAMADAIAELFGNPEIALGLGARGREIIDEEFRFPHYLYDLLEMAGAPLQKVSVVVPNYNYERYIEDRLRTVAEQTIQPYEIIVLDDASPDESVTRIEQFIASCDVPSRLVVNEQNSGSVFRQWQRGVKMARGDFVWVAEADDLADPGFLAELLPAFDDSDVVMAYCQSRQMDGDGKILCEHYLDYVSDIDRERWTRPYRASGVEEIAGVLCVKNAIPNVSAVLFRKPAIAEVLDESGSEIMSYKVAGDWVAYLRLLEKGSIAFVPDSLNSHRRHQSGVTVGNFNMKQLMEIVRVQRETAIRHDCDGDALRRADEYAQVLYEQFGLPSTKYPRYSDHPEIIAVTEAENKGKR